MPNWVHHHLTITGPETELNRFLETCFTEDADGPHLNFDKLVPPPKGTDIDWAREHWGTKWGAGFTKVSRLESGAIRLAFDTTWTTPRPIFEEIAARFPELTIEGEIIEQYNFAGHVSIAGGESVVRIWPIDPWAEEPAP